LSYCVEFVLQNAGHQEIFYKNVKNFLVAAFIFFVDKSDDP